MDLPRILLISGGGRGIGAATASLAAERGFFVCFNYRQNSETAADLLSRIRNGGGDGAVIQADVGHKQEVPRMFKEIDSLPGELTGLVNSAGIVAPSRRFEETDEPRWQEIFRLNVFGTMHCNRAAIKRMSRRFGDDDGSIVNLSSTASRSGSRASM